MQRSADPRESLRVQNIRPKFDKRPEIGKLRLEPSSSAARKALGQFTTVVIDSNCYYSRWYAARMGQPPELTKSPFPASPAFINQVVRLCPRRAMDGGGAGAGRARTPGADTGTLGGATFSPRSIPAKNPSGSGCCPDGFHINKRLGSITSAARASRAPSRRGPWASRP